MLPYHRELGDPPPDDVLAKITRSMMERLGPCDRHLELVYAGRELAGFLQCKVDHADHAGFVKPGWGYVMEFYVVPEFRRMSYGRAMIARMEEHFVHHGVSRMWLTASADSHAFWRTAGFAPTGEICPDNDKEIWEKCVG
ncbi:MAG: GNAT family N-acetyltransferase [Oscillospiraceae bacterium]|nr:GNAT family N-acetyltransferase [Oscillospiraceae bacterium]